jgi:Domain of unknown function (DUF4190)
VLTQLGERRNIVLDLELDGISGDETDSAFDMSDFSQGPGYWQASDGKWYPPQPPAPPPVAAYGSPPPVPPMYQAGYMGQGQGQPVFPGQIPNFQPAPNRGGTSGLAIASLVLGLLWLCGLGSILAIILGFVALSSIKRTGQSGKGMAIAGVVLGFVALAVTVVLLTSTAIFLNHAKNSIGTATERKDFTITSCLLDETSKIPTAEVTVHNNSSKTSGYWVEIAFSVDGKVVETAGGAIIATATVEPGQSQVIEVKARRVAEAQGKVTCRIAQFDRFAAPSGSVTTTG